MAGILWIISALYLTIISQYLFTPQPPYSGGGFYIFFYLIYIVIVYGLWRKWNLKEFHLSPFCFVVGVLILILGEPLFENDHYRYLWEGKVLFSGENPYLFSPMSNELKDIAFAAKDRIAYSHLSSVYPPLGLIWFGLAGVFDYPLGLTLMMLMNSLIVWYLIKHIFSYARSLHLLMVLPYFQKEFIQAVHIDILAVFLFTLAIVQLHKRSAILFTFLAYWSKVISLIFYPFQILFTQKKLNHLLLFFCMGISLPIFLFLITDISTLSGVKSFSQFWIWSPGFFRILSSFFPSPLSRFISLGAYALFYFFLLWRTYQLKSQFHKEDMWGMAYFVFAGLMFFSPVYNGWYAVWFLIPALLIKSNMGVFYGLMSIFCYTAYFDKSYLMIGETLCHTFFIFSLWELRSLLRGKSLQVIETPVVG